MARGRAPSATIQFEIPERAASFDVEAFDAALHDHGVLFKHWRATPCPAGMVDRTDTRRPHPDHSGCSNGYIYTLAGEVKGLFTSNSMLEHLDAPGMITGASCQITLPRCYDSTPDNVARQVMLFPSDRLYLAEEAIVVVYRQRFEHSLSGIDKLNFPVVEVHDLIDADLNRYDPGGDFVIEDGKIRWVGRRPAFDGEINKGKVCSVRYTYRPYWYVKHLIHEVRVAQVELDFQSGQRGTTRMPQAAMLQREYAFENENRDDQAPDPRSPRQHPTPSEVNFGPR